MSDALEENDGKVSIGGRNIINLRSADDIAALAEEKQELEALVESLDKILQKFCAEKTKLMTKQRQWHPERDKGNRGEARYCNKLQVPWADVSEDGYKPEILSRIAQATAALTK